MLLFSIKGMAVLTFIICLLTNDSKAAVTNFSRVFAIAIVLSPIRYFHGLRVAKKAKKNNALR